MFYLFKLKKLAFVSIVLIVFWNNYLFLLNGSEICFEAQV
ncbi:hypothetical protein VCRA2128O98_90010 [Vibrio crassostreae]|nr:hypothetical protein VCRA2110O182_160007 [Vibrio crassostreae]CAK2282132.1 hypothetical protein VCRA2111O408_180084 [Vibrio crassostreae]CAK2288739.1 hypothetical protein VCRA211O406_150085 [Vibrio crassostreae]CAK2579480.1 hypothetical protein VCRA2127O91_100155 [Vibrio crassostreae]CAK3113288.1 hypothetical protein VCRA2123O443_180001 [Vibrio crassostreae]